MSWRLRTMIGCLAVVVLAAPALAQQAAIDEPWGKTVAAVRFEIEGRPVVSKDLDVLLAIHVGEPLRIETERDSIRHLYNVGRYDDVQVFYTAGPNGVDVLFRLTPRHPVDRLQFTGDTGLSASELDRLIRERYGGLPAREQPENVATALSALLRDEGFLNAQVTPRIEQTHNPDRATLILQIAAGSRAVIARTDVAGTSPLPAEKIVAQTGTAAGQAFRRRAIEAALAAVGDGLRRQGYFGAVALMPTEPVQAPGGEGLVVTLRVDAGPRVTLRWDGAKPPGADEDYVPMQRQRSVDEDLLEDSDARVSSYWRREGYKDVTVTHSRDGQGEAVVVTMHTVLGPRYRIADVKMTGNAHLREAAIRETLQVGPGDPYDQARITTGIGVVTQTYRRLGYYLAVVKELDPDAVAGAPPGEIREVVHIDIAEGPEAHVGTLSFTGNRVESEAALRDQMRSKPGGLYLLDDLLRDQAALDTFYRDRGFEDVDVVIKRTPSADQRTIDVVVGIAEGPQVLVGDIRVIGNRKVSEENVKKVMTLREGGPYGEADKFESSARIYRMGVFRQVNIAEEPRLSGETVAHVIVTVEELPANSDSYGFGLEAGRLFENRLEFAPRGFFEVGRRNLWGKNRSVDFFSRISPGLPNRGTNGQTFTKYRVATTYREPHAFNSDTDALVGVAFEQAVRTGFNFARKTLNAEFLRRVSSRVSVSGRYGLEYTRLFDVDPTIADQVTIDRFFPQVRLSILSSGAVWDRRNDPVDPVRGTFTTADWEIAGRSFGSEVGYTKVFLQESAFHALKSTRRVVLAGRAEVGFARGFEREVVQPQPDGSNITVTVADLPVSQRFFAGGSTTVRGFQLDRLGVPGILTTDGLSIGGNGVVVLNAEVRTALGKLLGREFGVVGFMDAGNVFAKAGDIDFTKLRGAYGFGLRYNSPLGPVRLDFGFKMDRQLVAGKRERGWEYHLNIGEAF
jgi:outer membrane protein insertion porin family